MRGGDHGQDIERTGPTTTVRHVARALGSTGSAAPAYRVDLHVGPHQLVADEPRAAGGGDLGPSPFGLLLSALAACTATTLRMYAARHGWDLTTIDVDLRYDITDDRRGAIERKIIVPADLPSDQQTRLAEVAERTPVTVAIRAGTPITTTLESLNHGSGPTTPGRPPAAGGASGDG